MYRFLLEQAAKLMELDNQDRSKCIVLYFNVATFIPIIRVFKLLKWYCEPPTQQRKFQNQNWYIVAVIIRNYLSHNFGLEIQKENELKKLPYKWENIRIPKKMLGNSIVFSDISSESFTHLCGTMASFGHQLD